MDMLPIVIGLFGLLVLDLASWRWGANSIERFDSPEWEKRRLWRGFTSNG